ncbi:MAG: PfkB family carbohydrate kinase [Spirochaetia bacterium]
MLKINALELGTLAAAPTDDLSARAAACCAICSRFGVRWLLITRGPQGIEAFDGRGFLHARPPAVKVLNAIGSGDAATAMGTANCMNPVNGKVERADYLSVMAGTAMEEIPLTGSAGSMRAII